MSAVTVVDARAVDVPQMVDVHERSFPSEFLTSLGPDFLTWYYRRVIAAANGVALVAKTEQRVVGFVCGTYEGDGSGDSLVLEKAPAMRAAVSIVFGRPQRIPALLQRYRWLGSEGSTLEPFDIELASLATEPSVQGQGIGKILVRAFADRSISLSQEKISLTTNEYGNDGVIAFYEKLGFQRTRGFQRDRPMVQFIASSSSLI